MINLLQSMSAVVAAEGDLLKAISDRLRAEGARVGALSPPWATTSSALSNSASQVRVATHRSNVGSGLRDAASAVGGVDVLVVAADSLPAGSISDENFLGWMVEFIDAATPYLRRSGRSAVIAVTAADIFGGGPAVDAVGGGVVSLVRGKAALLGPENVRANTVVADLRPHGSEGDPNPLDRICTPEDVAAAVAWLASPRASYVTGHCLVLDGGRFRR